MEFPGFSDIILAYCRTCHHLSHLWDPVFYHPVLHLDAIHISGNQETSGMDKNRQKPNNIISLSLIRTGIGMKRIESELMCYWVWATARHHSHWHVHMPDSSFLCPIVSNKINIFECDFGKLIYSKVFRDGFVETHSDRLWFTVQKNIHKTRTHSHTHKIQSFDSGGATAEYPHLLLRVHDSGVVESPAGRVAGFHLLPRVGLTALLQQKDILAQLTKKRDVEETNCSSKLWSLSSILGFPETVDVKTLVHTRQPTEFSEVLTGLI